MKKGVRWLCFVLVLLLLPLTISATDIDDEIDAIAEYSEDYELGKINYLQLVVYVRSISEDINSRLGREYGVEGDYSRSGLSEEEVKKIFGNPTHMTNWVWVVNQDHDERLEKKLPTWEKRLFDGRKIMIMLNAWPQLIKKDDGDIIFYGVDFNVRFKTHYEFDIYDMLKDLQSKAQKYVKTGSNGEEVAETITDYEHFLHNYLESNNDECKNIMSKFFSPSDKQQQQKKVRYEVNAYDGDNLALKLGAESCLDCDWSSLYMWFDLDIFERDFEYPEGKSSDIDHEKLKEKYADKDTDWLEDQLKKSIRKFTSLIEKADKDGRFKEPERVSEYWLEIEGLNMVLDEYYNEFRWRKGDNFEDRRSNLLDILGEFGDVNQEALTEIRYENRLVEEYEEIIFKSCRQFDDVSCPLDQGCITGECFDAKGGLEDCHNGKDDDGDGITDCPDPDCAADCGWICKDQCDEGCNECPNRECQTECQECWNCDFDKDQKKCEELCRDSCWECEEEKCRSQPVCENCQECQQEARDEFDGEKCKLICAYSEDSQECEDCQRNLKYNECRDICDDGCNECKRENCHETNICQKCWECNEKGDKECGKECDDCWDCERDSCYNTGDCDECKKCENKVWREIEKENCDKTCKKKGEGDQECKNCRADEKRHICDEVCQAECWPCQDIKCEDQCEECWDCDFENDGKACENLCQSCWECNDKKCKSQSFCTSCNECEERIWLEENPCALPCDVCNDCNERGDSDEEYCIDNCNECSTCGIPENVGKCISTCNKIIDETDKIQLERCKEMCHDEVIFYCNGVASNTPCPGAEYICGGRIQKIPCNIFECTNDDQITTKQTVFCGQETSCGQHRNWLNGQCICEDGWFNCDELAQNGCESKTPCEGAKEICLDSRDNDMDGLIDCMDLSDCENMLCDEAAQKVCSQGSCVKDCPDNQILNKDDICIPKEVCMVGFEYDDKGNCVKAGAPSGNKTINITENVTDTFNESINIMINETINSSLTAETNETVDETGGELLFNRTSETNETEEIELNETEEPELNETEIPETEETELNDSRSQHICDEGKEHVKKCESGEEIVTEICTDGQWIKMMIVCPPAEKNIECPDGYYFKDNKCLFIEDEKIVCTPWQELNDKGICVDIEDGGEPKREDDEIIETDKRCVVLEDCEDENAICSKGKCKLLPSSIIGDEEEIIVETIETGVSLSDDSGDNETDDEEHVVIVKGSDKNDNELADDRENKQEDTDDIIGGMIDDDDDEGSGRESINSASEEETVQKEDEPTIGTINQDAQEDSSENLITGNLLQASVADITGLIIKNDKECEKDSDCGENRGCDSFRGQCYCQPTYFDCNGGGDGKDKDGCESQDPTCGGRWQACRWDCKDNQECIEELGHCECKDGYYDCDGDWENGCESESRCGECTTDDDCAPPRCNDWDNSITKFACVADNSHMEDSAVISFSGGCFIKDTGRTETYLHFDVWGKELRELEELRRRSDGKENWCKREIEGYKKQRKELEKSFNEDFLQWFFDDYIEDSPAEWEGHIEGIFATYRQFEENAKELYEMTRCTQEDLGDVELIDIEYQSDYGDMHYWEEIKEYEGTDIITPFMQIWIFPPKDIIKNEFKTAMKEKRMPGPEGDKGGPTPKDIEMMKKDEKLMEKINDLSNKYGGSADFLIEIKDSEEALFKVHMGINPEDIFEFEILSENESQEAIDVNVAIDFDFLYETIKTFEKGGHIESPHWVKEKRRPIKGAVDATKIFTRITLAMASGDIKVSPITATPTVINFLKMMAGGSMESD